MVPGSTLIRLSPDTIIKPFDCADVDLNDFFLNESKHYLSELLAVTYIIENDTDTIAFFSVLNDKISAEDVDSKRKWKRFFQDKMPNQKRYHSYPAVKIGRLGVSNAYKSQGVGTEILDYIKGLFINNNKTGCRYITVDAYRESLAFYEKNDFIYLTINDMGSDTRLMYFDLILIS